MSHFFFENMQRVAVTVNCDRYRAMLIEFLFRKIEENDIGNIWFQQDSATCPTAAIFLEIALLAAALMSLELRFKPLDYYLWTISVTPTNQRQLML